MGAAVRTDSFSADVGQWVMPTPSGIASVSDLGVGELEGPDLAVTVGKLTPSWGCILPCED